MGAFRPRRRPAAWLRGSTAGDLNRSPANRSHNGTRLLCERNGRRESFVQRRSGAVSPENPRCANDLAIGNRSYNGPPWLFERFHKQDPLARPSHFRPVAIRVPKAGSCSRNQRVAVNLAVESIVRCQFLCRDYSFGYQIDRDRPRRGAWPRFQHPNWHRGPMRLSAIAIVRLESGRFAPLIAIVRLAWLVSADVDFAHLRLPRSASHAFEGDERVQLSQPHNRNAFRGGEG